MMITDVQPVHFLTTASPAPPPLPALAVRNTTASTSMRAASYALKSSTAASSAKPLINAKSARLKSTIHSMRNAGNAQINSQIAEPAQLKPVTNAQIPPLLIMGSVFRVEISALAAKDAQIRIYARSVYQMHSILMQQSVTSAWIYCSNVKPVVIKHSALAA